MSFFDQTINTTQTAAEKLAEAKLQRDQQWNEQAGAANGKRPDWADDTDAPQISLDAHYAGTVDPANVPKDSVTYTEIKPGAPRDTRSEPTAAQIAGTEVAYALELKRQIRQLGAKS